MIDHFEINVVKFQECVCFYTVVLKPLNIELKWSDESAAGYGEAGSDRTVFLIEQSALSQSCHIAFIAPDSHSVDKFHIAGVEGGYVCNGKPGIRAQYAPDYYAAFLRDPDGNNIEAVARDQTG